MVVSNPFVTDKEAKRINLAVTEYIEREGFLTHRAVPQAFFDDVLSEGIDPERHAPFVFSEIRERLANLALQYEIAAHNAINGGRR
jgi:hypothetical protein